MKKHIAYLSSVFFLALIASWVVAGKLVSAVPGDVQIPETNLPIESFTIESQSGETLAGWHINAQTRNGVIVLFHGLRTTKAFMFQRAKLLYENGYSVVLVDFQSHGESTGNRITLGYLEKYDVLASIEYAKAQHLNQPLGIIGVSLGGASTLLASPQDIDALIVESAYSDIHTAVHNRVKARLGALSWLPAEILLAQLKPRLGIDISELSPIENINRLSSPIFVISGADDVYTTEDETKNIFARANEPKQLWLAKGIAHEDIFSARPKLYTEKVIEFFNLHMRKQI